MNSAEIDLKAVWDSGSLHCVYTPGTAGNVCQLSLAYRFAGVATLLAPFVSATISITGSTFLTLSPPPGSTIFRVTAQSTGTAGPNDALTAVFIGRGQT